MADPWRKFGNIPVHVHREKPRKILQRRYRMENLPRPLKELKGLCKEVDLLASEKEMLDDLDLDFAKVKVDNIATEE